MEPPSKAKPRTKFERRPGENKYQAKLREQREDDQRRRDRYAEARAGRVSRLRSAIPEVDRYVKLLERIRSGTTAYSRRDCDQDLGDVVTRLGLASLVTNPYDRFTLVELTLAWLADIAKAQRTYSLDDVELMPDLRTETIDEVKKALALS